MWGDSLTHPKLTLFLCGEFVLHIQCYFDFYARIFSYTSRATVVCLFVLSRKFLLHIPYWFLLFIGVVSLTHPVLALFLAGEYLQYIPCWLDFYRGGGGGVLLRIPC